MKVITKYKGWFIALALLCVSAISLYLIKADYNRDYGSQLNFDITTIIVDKIYRGAERDQNDLIFQDLNSGRTYKVKIKDYYYYRWVKGQHIRVIGKKGSLGILYDIKYERLD